MALKPKILLITPGFPADETDSQCIPALQDYAAGLAGQFASFEFEVLALHYPHQAGTYLWNNLTVTALAMPSKTRWQRAKVLLQAWRWFRAREDRQAFVGIHAFWLSNSAVIASTLARWYGKKYLVTMMGQDVLPANHYHRWLKPGASSLAVPSCFAMAQYTAHRPVRPMLIPWGFGPDTHVLGDSPTLEILAVGSLIPLKNFKTVIQIVAQLRDAMPHIRAQIVGEGPEFSNLQSQIETLGMSQNCQLRGALPRDQVHQLMRQAKVLVHPSHFESFGHVFVEALANGMAIVSQAVGIAKPSEAWQIATTPQEFATATLALLNRPPKREKRWPYPLANVFQSYRAVYEDWVENGRH